MVDDKMLLGITGTAVSAVGTSLSVTEIQAIVSIVVTVLGFVISVLIPLGIKLFKQIKEARKDGKIDKEEAEEIINTGKDIVDAGKELYDNIKEKKDDR